MSGWNKNLASIWTNNVAPSRPSNAEMCVYTKYLRELQSQCGQRIKMLVLGSTPEFRDWGFEQAIDISVVDKSIEYHKCISREIRHKNIKESVYVQNWEEMTFDKQFDLIIGDLAIGNVDPDLFHVFLQNVNKSLSKNGFFLGKSLIWDENELIKSPTEIIDDYRLQNYIHPYTFINHRLGLYCLDRNTNTLDFSIMFNELKKLYENGYIDQQLFSYLTDVGWSTEMKFKFFAPTQKQFIDCVNQELQFVKFEHTEDCYTNVFPIYVIKKGGYFK